MHKTKATQILHDGKENNEIKITVDINGLMQICSCGKTTAYKIGEDAGAVIRIGRRKLYNVQLVQEYMNSLARG